MEAMRSGHEDIVTAIDVESFDKGLSRGGITTMSNLLTAICHWFISRYRKSNAFMVKMIRWYRMRRIEVAAKQGDAVAQYTLGLMYAEGRGDSQNDTKAIEWLGKAAEHGVANPVRVYLDYMCDNYHKKLGVHKGKKREVYRKKVRRFRQAAEQGGAQAKACLGAMYALGRGVSRNDDEALRWLKLAARQDARAQASFNAMTAEGYSILQDIADDQRRHTERDDWLKSYFKFEENAKGDACAQAVLGFMYAAGKGVSQNDDEAVHWLKLAAEQGDVGAQIYLGTLYAIGRGWRTDYASALRCYREVAEAIQEDAEAPAPIMALICAACRGVLNDYATAVRWFCLAGVQQEGLQPFLGDINKGSIFIDTAQPVSWFRQSLWREDERPKVEALVLLGLMYASGRGVCQYDAEAVDRLMVAAKNGNSKAQTNLGLMYHAGFGVTQNYPEALKWLHEAGKQGHTDAAYELDVIYKEGMGMPLNVAG